MNDQIFTDPVDKANLLGRMFAENSTLPESSQPKPELARVSCTMPKIFFRARPVKMVLEELNVNTVSALVFSKTVNRLTENPVFVPNVGFWQTGFLLSVNRFLI